MTQPVRRQKVLIVDDEERIRAILQAILVEEGYEVHAAKDGVEALRLVPSLGCEVMIVDLQMPKMNGIETLTKVREIAPDTVAIVLTAHGSIETAVQAIKHGAYDYLTKPFDNEQLLVVVQRAAERARLSREIRDLRQQVGGVYAVHDLLGESAKMKTLRQQLVRVAEADATVLIEGESGTGKELAARAIHHRSKRRGGPFIVIDCTAIPSSLIESTFFGHEKGAFTDALERRPGKFEEADGGTAFLDEIGELPHDAQAKLLRVLQEHEFTRVGGTTPIKVDVRVIAATNKELAGEAREGRFREDLFYRLDVLKVEMIPLRDHPEDIPLLAKAFVVKHGALLGSQVMDIAEEALHKLEAHRWPGNVRELENSIQRAMLLAHGPRIEMSDLPRLGSSRSEATERGGLEDEVRRVSTEAEREMIVNALRKAGWNRTAAAELLDISRKTLFNKMQMYGITPDPEVE